MLLAWVHRHCRFYSTQRPTVIVRNVIQRNPIILKKNDDFVQAYSLYDYEALAKEQTRGVVLMPTSDSLQKEKSAAEIEIIISKQKEFEKLHEIKVKENDHDLSSLNRKPSEKLYLLVKTTKDPASWQWPSRVVKEANYSMPLHKISEENFTETVGRTCEHFHVSCRPIAANESANEHVRYSHCFVESNYYSSLLFLDFLFQITSD